MADFVDHVEIRPAHGEAEGQKYVVTVGRNGEDLDVSETLTPENAHDHADELAGQLGVRIEVVN